MSPNCRSTLLFTTTFLAMLFGRAGTLIHAEPTVDKGGFHLFNPTPRELMRELSADRPDGTESPYTVDAGHFQMEASLFDFTHDDESERVNAWAVFDTNFKLGLTNNSDLQIAFASYEREEIESSGLPDESADGFGDVTVRWKWNLWGNDGGETAFGLMPFVKIPSGTDVSNERVEGGLIAMLGWNVAETWSLGFMAEVDAVYDDVEGDYDAEFVHTAVLGMDLIGDFGAYVEYIGIASTEGDAGYRPIASVGLTYALTADLVFDVGTQIGLAEAADDVNVFTGFTWRY